MTSTMLPRMATDRFATGLAIAATLIATLCISTATTTQARQSAQPRCPAGYWLLEPVCLRPLPSPGITRLRRYNGPPATPDGPV